MNMFSQNEILLMILVVSVLLVFIVILTILDIREYKKNKKVEKVLDLKDENIINEVEEKNNEEVLIVEDNVALNEKSDIVVNAVEPEEDNLVFEELEEVSYSNLVNVPKEEITYEAYVKEEEPLSLASEIAKVEETVHNEDNFVTSFEEEQERTAIISLDELMKKTDELYNENEVYQYDDGNEPISIDEVINMYNKEPVEEEVKMPEVMQEVVEEKKEAYTKKESIPFISSIYGMESEMSFENTANYEKFDRAENNEFMRKLREMNEK